MNIKNILSIIFLAFILCIVISAFTFHVSSQKDLDVVEVNDITKSFGKQWNELVERSSLGQWEVDKIEDLSTLTYDLDFVVIDNKGNLMAATRLGLNEYLSSAIRNRDTIVDIVYDEVYLGKLIIYNDFGEKLKTYRLELLFFVWSILSTVALLCTLFVLYYDRKIFRPFRKLQVFARQVAEGNLDLPLEMDKDNIFGAFTESFDLMREEISRARQNERKANQSKKELVASLSHDIKTPVASIKAVSELVSARSEDEILKKQVDIINLKADQIDTLVTNLFTATLEELQELKVSVSEQSSIILYNLINNADYNKLINMGSIGECLILVDELRLAQVIDNVLSNSYKYAGTPIEVSSLIKGNYLEIYFKDYGPGVPKEESALLFNKYYRAKNSIHKSGTGLGLYISKYIMNKMSGDIMCVNVEEGFVIKLKLKIV